MRFRQYFNERRETPVNGVVVTSSNRYSHEGKGRTTKDNGHDHGYDINPMTGDGKTTNEEPHIHIIKGMIVKPANGHSHELR